MRGEFGMEIERYGTIAKKQTAAKKAGKKSPKDEMAQYDLADELAKYYEMPIGVQLKIFDLQKEKQNVMDWLKDELKKLDVKDNLVELRPGSRWVVYPNKDRQLVWRSGDKETVITLGDLIADLDWQVSYSLDPETVPRDIRKQYLVATAKRRLKDLLDEQIMRQEIASEQDDDKWLAYKNMLQDKDIEKPGIVAEKMLRNFMTKLAMNYGLDFNIVEADAFQDVEQKIDFVIEVPRHQRGVRVDKTGGKNLAFGIQFTTDTSWEAHIRKNRQLGKARTKNRQENIDDMVLVEIDLQVVVKDALDQWKKEQNPGGPDQNLPLKIKREIFFKLLKGIYSETEIQTMWQKVEPGMMAA
jgi:hypothetical protein